MIEFYTNGLAPLRDSAGGKIKYLDIPPYKRVTGHESIVIVQYAGRETRWRAVTYDTGKRQYAGWVYDGFLDLVTERFEPVLKLKTATPDPHDASQYIIYGKLTQYNLCGEMSVLYCADWDELDVVDWLDEWKHLQPSAFSRIFSGGRSRGTGLAEVEGMFKSFGGYTFPMQTLAGALKDNLLGRPVFTPERIAALLTDHRVIYGCNIGSDGNLRGSGIGHWVVLESILIEAINRARVTLYNPYHNRLQEYSWQEVVASGWSVTGLLAPRGSSTDENG